MITDANGCTYSLSNIIVGNSSELDITETHVDVLCNGGNTGSINITTTGGVMPYVYDWADIIGTNDGEDRTNLAIGTYNVTVIDSLGCSGTISIEITQPTLLTLTGSQILQLVD